LKKYVDDIDVGEIVDDAKNSQIKGKVLTFEVSKEVYETKKELLDKLKKNNMIDGSWEAGHSTLWVIFDKNGQKMGEIDYDRKKILIKG